MRHAAFARRETPVCIGPLNGLRPWAPHFGPGTPSRHLVSFSLGFIVGVVSLGAQGTLTVLLTGGGQPSVSKPEMLPLAGIPAPAIRFEFGFVTDEVNGVMSLGWYAITFKQRRRT